MAIEIQINASRAIVDNGTIRFDASHDELVTYSGGLFTGLPSNVRYYYRNDDKEFWQEEDGNGGLRQVAAEQSFSTMIDTMLASLTTIVAAYDAANTALYSITLSDGDTVTQGNPFSFNILYNGAIEVGVTKVTLNLSAPVPEGQTQVIIDIDNAIEPVELLLADAGFWQISSNVIEQITVEVI